MRYFWRVFFIVLGAALVLGAVMVAMLVVSSHQGDLYDGRVKAAFNAAALSYMPGDPARTVEVTYAGKTCTLDPDSYRALSFYLRLNAVKAYFPRATDGESVSVAICETDALDAYRVSADEAYVVFRSGETTMKMTIRGSGLWEDLVGAATSAAQVR
jgi:hypothetical protein